MHVILIIEHGSFFYGHTKGDLAFDGTSGFWLVHSVPKFPPYADKYYDYPESGKRYGQSFLCVSFNYSMFNEIALQLLYNGPQIYDYYLPDVMASDLPNMKKVVEGEKFEQHDYLGTFINRTLLLYNMCSVF